MFSYLLNTRYQRPCHFFFFHEHSRFTGQQGKEEANSLIPLYHFHSIHKHFITNWTITAESPPLHMLTAGLEPGTFGFRAQVANH